MSRRFYGRNGQDALLVVVVVVVAVVVVGVVVGGGRGDNPSCLYKPKSAAHHADQHTSLQ